MRTIRTTEEFEKVWNEAGALIVDFSAVGCGPCRMLEPLLRRLEKECTGLTVVKVDVDEHNGLSDAHEVLYMPTLLFVKDGKALRRPVGFLEYGILVREARRLVQQTKNKRE